MEISHFFRNGREGEGAPVRSGSLKKPRFVPGLIRSTEEQTLLIEIEQTHVSDHTKLLEVRPLFHLVEHIIGRTCEVIQSGGHEASGSRIQAHLNISLDVSLLIERVSCEMGCKCLGGAKTHDVTMSILETLANYTWEAKLVIALAAFSVSYGEFLLLSQAYSTDPLGQSMMALKHLPSVVAQSEAFKSQFATVNKLVNAMLDVTRLVVEFSEYPNDFRNPQEPLAIYWAVESAVAASTLVNLIATHGDEYMPPRELEPSKFSNNITFVRDNLEKFNDYVMHMLEVKREEETYQMIRRTVFNMVHPDNLPVLKALIQCNDDVLPLYDGSQGIKVPLSELKGKTVLLLVTGLDITSNEIQVLKKIYTESKTHAYCILWIPIVNINSAQSESKFNSALRTMPWCSVRHASIVSNALTRFIKDDLYFKGKPILVALDGKGVINSTNAFNMMWIWKNDAFPITSAKEEALWKQETWNLELLFDSNHRIMDWIKEGKYIVVYGGDDIDWIQNFNKTAKQVMTASAKINLELIYVGKTCKNKKVQKIIAFMEANKLGHYLKDETDMWFFWTRLDSILQSKIQMGKDDDNTDKVTQEIKKLVSYDTNVGAWTILAKGSEIVHSGEGTALQEVFAKHEVWKKRADEVQFHVALRENLPKIGKPEHCCRFEFPTTLGKLPEKMKCPECKQTMNVKITFVCCHEGAYEDGAEAAILTD